jgi:AraC-like DNA-binding protein
MMSENMSCEDGAPLIEPPPTQLTNALRDLIRPELRSADLSVSSIVGRLPKTVSFPAAGPAAFSITLVLQGAGRTQIDGIQPLEMASGSAVIFWSDGPVTGQDHVDGGKPIEAVEVRLHTGYLNNAIGPMVDAIRNSLTVNRSDPDRNAYLVAVPMSAELFDVARSMLGCDIRDRNLRELFMRAKALETLALTLAVLSSAGPDTVRLTTREREKIDHARRIIEASFAEAWTIEALAAEVGLSETKLKTGFRQLIGKSVRTYLRDIRMNHAERLLGEGKSVTEAALACGYGSLSYFSKAFFNSKGVVPRRLSSSAR